MQKLGPVTYQVDTGNDNIVKSHVDQLPQRLAPQSVGSDTKETPSIEDDFQYREIMEPPSQEPGGGYLHLCITLRESQDHLTDSRPL